MVYSEVYLNNIISILNKSRETQIDAIDAGAQMLCDATLNGGNIFAFGCSHAGLLALELYYRTGGMANINPVRAPGLTLDADPATLTSQMERLDKYGTHIADTLRLKCGDVVIIHSVSGRNNVTVDFALRAREMGARVIAITNMNTTVNVSSRHPSGKNLYQVADLTIDNGGCMGDSSIEIPGVPEKVGPTSTAVGAALLNAMITQAVGLIVESGGEAPVFISANVEGGDEHNAAVLNKYKDNIFYMGRSGK